MAERITIEGGEELIRALSKFGADAEKAATKAIAATAIEIRGDIVKRYQRGPKSGIVYKRGSRSHQASKPGEAPATDSGRLASSVEFKMAGKFTATVGSNVVYGAYNEWGTRHIEPRPAWRPAVLEAEPKYKKRLEDALAKVIRRHGT